MSVVTPPPATATNVELVTWAFDVINTRDVTRLQGFWTDETVEYFPTGVRRGAAEIIAYFEEAFAALPDFSLQLEGVAGSGDDVFAHWHVRGTHSGAPWNGIVASGRAISFEGMDHFVIREGHVITNFVAFDQLAFARQVGFLPDDGTRADALAKRAFALRQKLRRGSSR